MAEAQQICVDQETFKQMEDDVLDQVMATSKALLETFKFRMLYGVKVTTKQNKETLEGLNKFRAKHANNLLKNEQTYKKYLDLY